MANRRTKIIGMVVLICLLGGMVPACNPSMVSENRRMSDAMLLSLASHEVLEAGLVGELSAKWGGLTIDLGSHGPAPMALTYMSIEPGCALGIIGSSGYLEVSVRGGSASQALGLTLGDSITLRKP